MTATNVGSLIEQRLQRVAKQQLAEEVANAAAEMLTAEADVQLRASVEAFNAITTGSYLYEIDRVSVNATLTKGRRDVKVDIQLGTLRYRISGHQMHYRDAWGIHPASLTGQLRSYLLESNYWLRSCTLNLSVPEDYDFMNADPDA